MITFIYGGASSGKSAFAEGLLSDSKQENKYYLATMSANDEESQKRIEKHRANREGKGFITLEYATDVSHASEKIHGNNAILLECISNLVANEMFRKDSQLSAVETADKIIMDIQNLSQSTDDFIIVSNNIFEDGIKYDLDTKEYMRALGRINQELAAMSDQVFEVVVGIPIKVK